MKRGSHSAAAGRRCTAARWCVHLLAWDLKLHKHSELKMTDSKKQPACFGHVQSLAQCGNK